MLFGAIETGGSKVICAVGTGPHDIRDRVRIPTTMPAETLAEVNDFLLQHHRETPLAAVGVGSFGPLDLHPASPTYGYVLDTPKPGWPNTDLLGPIQQVLDLPVALDTDVNASALGEHRWGAGVGLESLVYITVGTGIGGGAVVAGRPVHGASHPEMGHVRIPHDRESDPFEGFCPYHGDCFEGLAAGPAIELRWGIPGESLPEDHPAWALEAEYLAAGIANIVLVLSPQRIVVGGGVMEQRHLFPMIRERVVELLHGYGVTEKIVNALDDYVVPPALGDDSGIAGAFGLAEMALTASGEAT
ncbi:MAG: ROK family protein [Dehalococcoidia bacterium]|nr:ROK family protein [Dehalococcoidia bacterium]